MSITQEERMSRYEALNDQFRKIFSSEEAASLNRRITEKYSMSEEQVTKFLEVTGDVILGFYKIADLPRLLQKNVGVSADESQKITSELIEFLSPVVHREEEEAKLKKDELKNLADTFSTSTEKKQSIEFSEQSERHDVQPLHTMAGDANRVHGYGSLPENRDDEPVIKAVSQEETLKR